MALKPFVPVANHCRVKISGTHLGGPFNNLFYIRYQGSPPDQASLTALAAQISSDYGLAFGPVIHTLTVVQRCDIWDLSANTGALGFDTTTHAGTAPSANAMSASMAVAISWQVQMRWRGGHFRTYLPGRVISDLTSGRTLTSTYHDAVLTAARGFRTAVNGRSLGGATVQLAAVRYHHDAGQAYPSGYPLVINDAAIRQRIDTQRRRLGKETS